MARKLFGFEDQWDRLDRKSFVDVGGEKRLVCDLDGTAAGFVLYSADEWNSEEKADYEADSDGRVMRLGEYTGEVIPQSAMDGAVS